ncbi:MAG: hypothetical protein FJX65_08865 [Alphaproteobacteria bacterium]|nr:hypothetical protein [Alphaproteobacteria bacterium]
MTTPIDRADWHRYYSRKRVTQQWMQVHLLDGVAGERVLEIGPHHGFVTALLDNLGYQVTTLDIRARTFDRPPCRHIQADLIDLDPQTIANHDVILCCETLEHLPWEKVVGVLTMFRRSGAPWLITSVPYEGFQIFLQYYVNRFTFQRTSQFKKLRFLKDYTPESDPLGHKWEVGYCGYSLKAWETMLRASGWAIEERQFTAPTRSVFHRLRNMER